MEELVLASAVIDASHASHSLNSQVFILEMLAARWLELNQILRLECSVSSDPKRLIFPLFYSISISTALTFIRTESHFTCPQFHDVEEITSWYLLAFVLSL